MFRRWWYPRPGRRRELRRIAPRAPIRADRSCVRAPASAQLEPGATDDPTRRTARRTTRAADPGTVSGRGADPVRSADTCEHDTAPLGVGERPAHAVDAPGEWLVGAKGEYPLHRPYLLVSLLRRPTQSPRRRSRSLWRAPRPRLGRPMRQAYRMPRPVRLPMGLSGLGFR